MIMLIGLLWIFIVGYSGIVYGTYKVLRENDLTYSLKGIKILTVPLMVILFYIEMALKNRKTNKYKSFLILKLCFLKYPLALKIIVDSLTETKEMIKRDRDILDRERPRIIHGEDARRFVIKMEKTNKTLEERKEYLRKCIEVGNRINENSK